MQSVRTSLNYLDIMYFFENIWIPESPEILANPALSAKIQFLLYR